MVKAVKMRFDEVVRYLEKLDIPKEEVPKFEGEVLVTTKRKDENTIQVVVKDLDGNVMKEFDIPTEVYVKYLKYGTARFSGGKITAPRGIITQNVLKELKVMLSNGEVKLPVAFKTLKEKGLVKERAQLYQIVKRYCNIERRMEGKRKIVYITGLKK